MTTRRWLFAIATLALGALQAWDSGILASTPGPQALTLVAILALASGALLAPTRGLYLAAMLVAAVLLIAARMISPTPLPELLLVVVFGVPALLGLAGIEMEARRGASGVGG